ncbi:MAG: 50S ribosomal protein L11 methyltransferase [Calditrichaeota bacterium]|nr:MAG: 50S ribosomal protein L11 methyltransferase [Calditrichota bacterium]MBL1207486.1 50S ribosomal protein L11 methyltransferase [Calditrichota bacterium]NOG47318.1 50S ribosomal protein L11 methyltransferase [Calditrichota bacterium]
MINQNNWIGITVNHSPEILEELSAQFFLLGCQGINEQADCFELVFSTNDFNEKTKSKVLDLLKSKNVEKENLQLSTIEPENWNENWKVNFQTFRIGQNIIIQPDWENYQAKAKGTVITIAPKMAFGTGHHETTRLILELMEDIIEPGMSVLDAGTGSAILAIYAAMKNAAPVVAFDNDPEAMENAEENCSLNGVSANVKLLCSDLAGIETKQYDLIVANINRNVLLQLATQFLSYSAPGNHLILSGLLNSDYNDILEAYKAAGWHLIKSRQQGEWMSLLMKMNNE